jgi:hypothetical protein
MTTPMNREAILELAPFFQAACVPAAAVDTDVFNVGASGFRAFASARCWTSAGHRAPGRWRGFGRIRERMRY